jgi:CubicO group peptidase (beta-lactamase class C family)
MLYDLSRIRGIITLEIRTVAAAVAASLALVIGAPATAQELRQIDSLFAAFDSPAAPGCAVAASHQGGVLFSRAYGMAHLDHAVPITPSTVFEVGSVAKQFAAAAILLLAQDGALSVDDDVRRYIPELPDYGATITLRHLITNTSGLREALTVSWSYARYEPITFEQFLQVAVRQRSLNHAPGEEWAYTGTGYILAAVVVQRVTGSSLAQFARERMFEPLGMNSTQWREQYRQPLERRATAYVQSGSSYLLSMPQEDLHGHGGLLSTVGDLLTWNEALATEKLGAFVTAELHREALLADGRRTYYGAGMNILPDQIPAAAVHHGGAQGGYRAFLGSFDGGTSVALLCNTNAPMFVLGHQVAELVLRAHAAEAVRTSSPRSFEPISLPEGRIDGYVGLFISDRTGLPLVVSANAGRLLAYGNEFDPVSPNHFRAGGTYALLFVDPDQLRVTDWRGWETVYRRAARSTMSEADLQALAGRYYSPEAAVIYDASIEDGQLLLRLHGRPYHFYRFDPVNRDLLMTPGQTVLRVSRDSEGNVSSLGFGRDRVWDLRFHPVSLAPAGPESGGPI